MNPGSGQPERPEPLVVVVGSLPAVDSAKGSLASREGGEVSLDEGPRPVGEVGERIAVSGLSAAPGTRRVVHQIDHIRPCSERWR